MLPNECSVIIAGGGPCGLMLANELGRRAISTVLIDSNLTTSPDVRANATQARTMEHYRRHGFADEIRALGLPPDCPTDIAYFTRFAGHELARFAMPSSAEAKTKVRKLLSGPWSAAELPHRVAQNLVLQTLAKHAALYATNTIRFNHRLASFADHGDHVTATIVNQETNEAQAVHAAYLVGADGPKSFVRDTLGIRYEGEGGAVRHFMGGTMLALLLRVPRFYEVCTRKPAWMYITFNKDRRAYMVAVDGKDTFDFHAQLRPGEDADTLTDAQALAIFQEAMGVPVEAEIQARWTWLAGRAQVAEHMQRGRVFLGGDAAHLFTPTGGMGYNTAVEDAVNLGWKLAAVVNRQAPASLLDSYESERRPIALRNTGFARQFADEVGKLAPSPELEDEGEAGGAARGQAGTFFTMQARREFSIPGMTLGYRYDGSPVIVPDGSLVPPDTPNTYIPTACPGGRAPHFWLGPDHSLYDALGPEWTLLRIGEDAPMAGNLVRAAQSAGMPLTVLNLPYPELSYLYEATLILIRPDQIVAWRGKTVNNAEEVIARVTGAATPQAERLAS